MAQQLCPSCGNHWPLGPTHCSTCGTRLVPQYHFVARPKRRALTLDDILVLGMLCIACPLLGVVAIFALGAISIAAPFLLIPSLVVCVFLNLKASSDARAWGTKLGFFAAAMAGLTPIGIRLLFFA